jgi:hypothetical protein
MQRRKDESAPGASSPQDAAAETDTTAQEQVWGKHDARFQRERSTSKMPHERDQSVAGTGNRLDEDLPPSAREISQSLDDIESGQVDTDRRGIPDDVPGSKRNREQS